MRVPKARSIDVVFDGRVFIGNLLSATSLSVHPELGITHILSVCPDFSSPTRNHMTIGVQDTEYDDLLIHLPNACQFIQAALDEGGKVLVHCVMGVSRSATVICAFLMQSRHMSVHEALCYLRQRRPRVQPNYGFMKQLHAFAACSYAPTPNNPAYRAWKRRQRQDITAFSNSVSDTVPILQETLYLSRYVLRCVDLCGHGSYCLKFLVNFLTTMIVRPAWSHTLG
ncbi:phosphatases II [Stereum hirsutum FP-91666 SS1]|uniref:phosphatases II n=1 Tax=Stereum hirsutum (strain FP-91666) TaxID=721885 RepID=UPI000440C089|nr:phosphatases II [Stereum hirsutum FP-91666 SS1]EIM88628.1 phosphatases II [Stereum hirsutum FP-91666 SS1]